MVILNLNTIDSSEAYKQIPICRDDDKARRADEKQSSALKICVAVSKEKGFSKDYEKDMKNPIKKRKNKANMWSTKNIRFCGKIYKKTAENKSK